MTRIAILYAAELAVGLTAAALLASAAEAHEAAHGIRYSSWCCNAATAHGGDCAPIDAAAVSATPDGFLVTLEVGDHPTVRKRAQRLFRYPDADPSNDRGTSPEALPPLDGRYHACVLPNSQEFRCFYSRLDGV